MPLFRFSFENQNENECRREEKEQARASIEYKPTGRRGGRKDPGSLEVGDSGSQNPYRVVKLHEEEEERFSLIRH